jgi:hypothetical protein
VAATRIAAALAVLAVGADHLEQYAVDHYDAVPTIGTLFLVNFAASLVVVGVLVAPLPRPRWWDAIAAAAGIAIAGGSLGALLVAEHGGLFGFTEVGYRPAILVSIALDATAILLVSADLVARSSRRRDELELPVPERVDEQRVVAPGA